MANFRKLQHRGLRTFADLYAALFRMVQSVCKNVNRIEFVFDSYVVGTVKVTERIRRANVRPIEINMITEETPLPVNIDTFWPSI